MSEPQQVNRGVLILKPKAPFHRWLSAEAGMSLAQARAATAKDQTGYLMPASGDIEPAKEVLEQNFQILFENELRGWCEDETLWPQPRTRAMFNQWFDYTYCDLVLDMDDSPLRREPWEEL